MDLLTLLRAQWDRVAGAALTLLGGLILLLGWRGAAQALYPAEQLPYLISGGLFGLFLLGVGATLWLSADLKDEWRQIRRLEDTLVPYLDGAEAQPQTLPALATFQPQRDSSLEEVDGAQPVAPAGSRARVRRSS